MEGDFDQLGGVIDPTTSIVKIGPPNYRNRYISTPMTHMAFPSPHLCDYPNSYVR